MTKQELLDYLGAACDVENAIFVCENVINSLQASRNTISFNASKPQKPEHTNTHTDEFYGPLFAIAGAIFVGVLFALWYLWLNITNSSDFTFFVWVAQIIQGFVLDAVVIAIGFVLFFIIGAIASIPLNNISRKKDAELDLANYNKMMTEYQNRYDAFEKARAIHNRSIDEIETAISEMRIKIRNLDETRKKLYANNVIHPTFQNMLAVNQIREYLEMGICCELEGPNGAYAVYMNDVRANRVCNSIEELRETIEQGFSRMVGVMSSFVGELRETNARISTMNSSLTQSLHNVQRCISDAQTITTSQIQAANHHLKNINQTLKDAAHNEYIAMKAAKVEGYLNLHRIS